MYNRLMYELVWSSNVCVFKHYKAAIAYLKGVANMRKYNVLFSIYY